ncbi:MAG: YceI family protein [Saprospiraceae bacterium]
MKKTIFLSAVALLMVGALSAQKFFTREGKISFFSDAVVEKIEAHNNTATTVLDTETNRLEFAVLIKGFQFEKALMQEHFNENYMESDQFPKASFKGQLTPDSQVNWKADGVYQVKVAGSLSIHGKTQQVTLPATFTIKSGAIQGSSSFQVAVADYGIEIPAVVRDNIAKEINIKVQANYQIFNK